MKNLKQVITNALLAVLGAMMLGFGAGYYLAAKDGGVGGYKFLQILQDRLSVSTHAQIEVYLYIAGMIMAIIFVSLLIVFALISLLCNFKVIKNEKVNKVLGVFKLLMAVFALIAFVLILISVLEMVENRQLAVGYGLIINVILSVLSIVVLGFAMMPAKKKA